VDLYHVPKQRAGAFGGLQHCGSPWACPVCASKITERRRVELTAAIASAEARGLQVLLVTYTIRHKRADSLKHSLEGLLKARKALLAGKWAKCFNERHGVVGRVRALEVTHGRNGWHPHVHELVFVQADVDQRVFLTELQGAWSRRLQAAGLRDVNEHGVDVRFADISAAEYVAKFGRERTWGPEHELTKAAAKIGKRGNRGPVGLLVDFLSGEDETAGLIWREYAREEAAARLE
jgi:hypothetical protein